MNEKLEKYRVKAGGFTTMEGDNKGLFFVPSKVGQQPLKVLCSPLGEGEWEHVSVSMPNRCPTWSEMTKIKNLFWGEDVTVVQYHPKKDEYVNNHKYCLHMWKKTNEEMELPPSMLVGFKELNNAVKPENSSTITSSI